MPEFKSLLLGLIFALGIFSVKSAFGLGYLLSTRTAFIGKAATLVTVALGYLALFIGSWYVASTIDLVSHFNRLKALFESGMVLHVLMAGGTLLWGICLLKRDEESRLGSVGWIALVVPCPVCASAIFFITGFLVAFYPDQSFKAMMGAYAVYLAITLLTITLLALSKRLIETSPERTLGLAMLFVSAYFLVSILVAPHFAEMETVYRIAANKPKGPASNGNAATVVGLIFVLSFAVGLAFRWLKARIRRDEMSAGNDDWEPLRLRGGR